MDLLSPIKDHHSERRIFIARVILTGVFGIILLGVLDNRPKVFTLRELIEEVVRTRTLVLLGFEFGEKEMRPRPMYQAGTVDQPIVGDSRVDRAAAACEERPRCGQ